MKERDAHRARTAGARGMDESALPQRHHLAPHETGGRHPGGRGQHRDRRGDRRPPDRHQHQGQEEPWNRQHQIGETHQERVDRTAGEAGDEPDQRAEAERDQRGGEADGERDATAVDQTAQQIPAEPVGPQREERPRSPPEGKLLRGELLPALAAPVAHATVGLLPDLVRVDRLSRRRTDRVHSGERRQIAQHEPVGLGVRVAQPEPGGQDRGQREGREDASADDESGPAHTAALRASGRTRGSIAATSRSAARLPATVSPAASIVAASTTAGSCARIAS